MIILCFLAFIGLVLSAAAHFSTFFRIDPQQSFPYIWLLHIGIFVVFIPAAAVQGMLPRNSSGKLQPFAFAPKWMQVLTIGAFIYMFVNFITFAIMMPSGSPYKENGQYVLREHGKLLRPITEQEYHRYRAYEVRGFSGHWMGFYAMAMTMLASAIVYRKSVADSGLSPTNLDPGRTGRPLWVHTVFAVLLQIVGFFFLPAIYIIALTKFDLHIGCCGAVLWLATPWPGLAVSLYLLRNKLPGTCPKCGGRAFWVSSRTGHYRCADCGLAGG
jgi:hypothetical protein